MLTPTTTVRLATLLVLAESVLASMAPPVPTVLQVPMVSQVPMAAPVVLVVLATRPTLQVSTPTALTAPSCQSLFLKITQLLNLTQVPA